MDFKKKKQVERLVFLPGMMGSISQIFIDQEDMYFDHAGSRCKTPVMLHMRCT